MGATLSGVKRARIIPESTVFSMTKGSAAVDNEIE